METDGLLARRISALLAQAVTRADDLEVIAPLLAPPSSAPVVATTP